MSYYLHIPNLIFRQILCGAGRTRKHEREPQRYYYTSHILTLNRCLNNIRTTSLNHLIQSGASAAALIAS